MRKDPLTPSRVARVPDKPLLVYDGDCGFCRKWAARWHRLTGDKVDYEPYQQSASRFPEIPLHRFETAVQLIGPDGRVSEGAEAVFKTLSFSSWLGWLAGAYNRVPGFAPASEALYGFVASHRGLFSSASSCGTAPADSPPSYFLARGWFLKVLALSYLAAFLSLWTQVEGLLGSSGILPAASFLNSVKGQLGASGFLQFPTLCWINCGDWFLSLLCAGGAALSLLLLFDFFPSFCLAGLWVIYLSLVKVGQDFLSFQWDNLLLEAGFLAIFMMPPGLKRLRGSHAPAARPILWLYQWLLFRLMFSSGVVKLVSGDHAWRNLTALRYHYETQPLPTHLAWVMNQLPAWFQGLSCLYMFGVELAVPFLVFGPRRLRPWAFPFLASLQVLIALTGNYCFFNLLALGLCLFTLEDAAWPAWARRRVPSPVENPPKGSMPRWVTGSVFAAVLYLSLFQWPYIFGWEPRWPAPLAAVFEILEPFQSVNSYGLFAVMTTTRPEIAVEGSSDGISWSEYEFKFKAGDLKARPRWAAPHQPRLDWQMWFAALGDARQNPWFVNFLVRLLQGSQPVLALLKTNPFPQKPPRFIRAQIYDYHFTDSGEKAGSGAWWKRKYLGPYIPAFSLGDVQP